LASWPANVLALLAGVVTALLELPQASGTAVLAGLSPAALPLASVQVLTPCASTSSFQCVELVVELGRTV
jgi:MFS superfamily sulfate permease-like transporter